VAEGLIDLATAPGRTEPPGRTRNRRKLYDERMLRATTPSQMLMAIASYIRGMFIDYTPAEIIQICHALAEAADAERRRLRGS
jgi:hypothetical protein